MTASSPTQHNLHPKSLAVRALQGAGIAFVLVSIFLTTFIGSGIGFQILLPMATTAIAGACGGIFYYLMDNLRYQGGWKKVVANIICVLVYIPALWISMVFAFAITGHWN